MLKITRYFDVLASKKNKSNSKIVKFDINSNGKESANKPKKLLKSRKISKSKKLVKSGNLFKNNITIGSSFLISNARKTFNCLKQVFIKTLIIWYFDLEYYI